MRVLFVQHGDFRETFQGLSAGGEETYYAQKYSMDVVTALVPDCDQVAVLCCNTDVYDEILPTGIRVLGFPYVNHCIDVRRTLETLRSLRTDHLVMRTPSRGVLRGAIRSNVQVLPIFADTFRARRPKDLLAANRLRRILNDPRITFVANHTVLGCESLEAIGVQRHKLIPWDWPHWVTPDDFSCKAAPPPEGPWSLIYVGSITDEKGFGDTLCAVRILLDRGRDVTLRAIGQVRDRHFDRQIEALGLGANVQMLGRRPHREVAPLMHQADAVVIPTQHRYSESGPMTVYEGLSARTPIVGSDHIAIRTKLDHRETGMLFEAGSARSLADAIEALFLDSDLYSRISRASPRAWQQLGRPALWGDIVRHWVANGPDDRDWLRGVSLDRVTSAGPLSAGSGIGSRA